MRLDRLLPDRCCMKRFIESGIPEEGCRVVLADGPEGEVSVDLYPVRYGDGECDLHWETNCPEAVGLQEIYEHVCLEKDSHRMEITWEKWIEEKWPLFSHNRRVWLTGNQTKALDEDRRTTGQTTEVQNPDGSTSDYLTLVEATRLLPGRRPGKRISVGTIWRWCQRGLRNGVRLRSVLVGGQRCTRREWLEHFIKAVSELTPEPVVTPLKLRTPEQRRRASERAAAELDALWERRKHRPD